MLGLGRARGEIVAFILFLIIALPQKYALLSQRRMLFWDKWEVVEIITKVVKVSKKGQITLPREVRESLGTEVVRIIAEGENVRIEPVKDLGGSLKQYASKYIPLEEARERAWTEAVSEKYGVRR